MCCNAPLESRTAGRWYLSAVRIGTRVTNVLWFHCRIRLMLVSERLRRVEAARSQGVTRDDTDQIRGDRQIQCDVLVALAECQNHRKWFAAFARPYLGEHPIEIGTGLGDYALEWIPLVEKYTATEAEPALYAELKKHMAAYPSVTTRQLLLPSDERGDHSSLLCYNVLEHIDDHVGALQSMARLVRPEGYIVLVCPAFPFAMSPVDIATGHVRRYTKRTMTKALTDAGLEGEKKKRERGEKQQAKEKKRILQKGERVVTVILGGGCVRTRSSKNRENGTARERDEQEKYKNPS